jgi:hypothetical protein
MTGAPIYKIAALRLQHTARLVQALRNLVDGVAGVAGAIERSRNPQQINRRPRPR